jgi:hypothetical protein
MTEKKYDRVQILLFANSYYGLLAARDHYCAGGDVMRSIGDFENIPEMRQRIEQWVANIPPELGDLWIERPRNLRDELLKKLDELEANKE